MRGQRPESSLRPEPYRSLVTGPAGVDRASIGTSAAERCGSRGGAGGKVGGQSDVSISVFLRQQNRGHAAVRFRDDPDFGSAV